MTFHRNTSTGDLLEDRGAIFSPERTHRYRLWRVWDPAQPRLCFVLLNPSTADEHRNDPTVTRCRRRAIELGFGALEVVNIFALCSTDPDALYGHPDPIGVGNDGAILRATRAADIVLCAWGTHGAHLGRGKAVEAMLRAACPAKLHVLSLNQDGSPGHPLYLPYAAKPVVWN